MTHDLNFGDYIVEQDVHNADIKLKDDRDFALILALRELTEAIRALTLKTNG